MLTHPNNVIFISSIVRVATSHDTYVLRKRTSIIPRIPIYNLASKQSHINNYNLNSTLLRLTKKRESSLFQQNHELLFVVGF